ncbi:hypothetical protein AU476_19175 [Cupriavidus sp. UYMSc13B]|nr:hypothetical protein AU476_19175 [Cupriavidus sp. UYMSc13B]
MLYEVTAITVHENHRCANSWSWTNYASTFGISISAYGQSGRMSDTPHFANFLETVLLQSSDDIRTVQELLGRSDVSTTMIYIHVLNVCSAEVRSDCWFANWDDGQLLRLAVGPWIAIDALTVRFALR